MGPRSDERGNDLSDITVEMGAWVLQWGRAPMSAEMPLAAMGWIVRSIELQWGRAPMSAEICSPT